MIPNAVCKIPTKKLYYNRVNTNLIIRKMVLLTRNGWKMNNWTRPPTLTSLVTSSRPGPVLEIPRIVVHVLVQVGHQATVPTWNHFARIHPFLQHHHQPGRSQRLQDWPGLFRETQLEQVHGGPGVRQQGAGRQA